MEGCEVYTIFLMYSCAQRYNDYDHTLKGNHQKCEIWLKLRVLDTFGKNRFLKWSSLYIIELFLTEWGWVISNCSTYVEEKLCL